MSLDLAPASDVNSKETTTSTESPGYDDPDVYSLKELDVQFVSLGTQTVDPNNPQPVIIALAISGLKADTSYDFQFDITSLSGDVSFGYADNASIDAYYFPSTPSGKRGSVLGHVSSSNGRMMAYIRFNDKYMPEYYYDAAEYVERVMTSNIEFYLTESGGFS